MSISDIADRLAAQPRATLAHAPTPIEAMPNLAKALGTDAGLWVKRDDCTGLAMGGNKARQLEFYFGQALAANADTVLITGAVQSNFVRSCAAAAAKLGMECHIQLEERVPKSDPLYRNSGNVLLNKLLGAHLTSYPEGEDEAGADAELERMAEEMRGQGKTPYVIHLAADHPPQGALGYVVAAGEILKQAKAMDLKLNRIVIASGSAATHGGTLFGLRAFGSDLPVSGICVRRAAALQVPRVFKTCGAIADILGCPNPVSEADVQVSDAYIGPGYGQPDAGTHEAIRLAARKEALILDPVYTGKTMAGMIGLVRDGTIGAGDNALFIHTGGTPAVFAYANDLEPVLAE